MAAANKNDVHVECVSKTSSTRVARACWLLGWYACIVQKTTTTVESWAGISYSDALDLCVSTEESTLNGTKRDHLGGATVVENNDGPSAWLYAENCWGTRVTSVMEKIGDSSLYQVKRTTEEMTVSSQSGDLAYS